MAGTAQPRHARWPALFWTLSTGPSKVSSSWLATLALCVPPSFMSSFSPSLNRLRRSGWALATSLATALAFSRASRRRCRPFSCSFSSARGRFCSSSRAPLSTTSSSSSRCTTAWWPLRWLQTPAKTKNTKNEPIIERPKCFYQSPRHLLCLFPLFLLLVWHVSGQLRARTPRAETARPDAVRLVIPALSVQQRERERERERKEEEEEEEGNDEEKQET